jgi:hypothetical protein
MSGGLTFMPAEATADRLQLLYADAAPLGVGRWRLALGFATPCGGMGPEAQIPPSALSVRPAEADRARLEVVNTVWAVAGRVLTVDVALRGPPRLAGSYVVSVDDPVLVDPAVSSARFVLPEAASIVLPERPSIDYLTKDYVGFRQHMIDAVSRLMPGWQDTSEPDLGVTVIESLAYGADFLSYYQDAVATEAYLDTARQRVSVRRHLRLLGATLSEGCAGRLFMRITVARVPEVRIPASCTYVTAPDAPAVVGAWDPRLTNGPDSAAIVYRQLDDVVLRAAFNSLPLTIETGRLQAGAVHFAVLTPSAAELEKHAVGGVLGVGGCGGGGGPQVLHPFRVRAISAPSGTRRGETVVVLVADPQDALPWDLHIRGGSEVTGNLVLAEFGQQALLETLPTVEPGRLYRPILSQPHVVTAAPLEPGVAASRLLEPDLHRTAASVTLSQFIPDDGGEGVAMRLDGVWTCVPDLLESAADARHFVAETRSDGRVQLRFGDGVFGRSPAVGTAFIADYRVGVLPSGVAGQGLLDTLVVQDETDLEILSSVIPGVANPTPSSGLVRADEVQAAILRAKAAFRVIGVCVTADDYVAAAESVDGVAEAAVRLERAGAVEVVRVRVRAARQLYLSETLMGRVREILDARLLAGRRVLIDGPRFARLRLSVWAEARPGVSRDRLRARIVEAFSDQAGGAFSPSNVAFGASVFASRLLEQLLAVEGVARGEILLLDRAGRQAPASVPTMLELAWDEIPLLTPDAFDIRVEAAS